ncbi:hypothetical protein BX600DRAFT_204590 [Xylariales sp. PMI_506]|nr:hypothetical protein BX600DRAFT_204590 [Xylariales sp. PMI_506]
MISLVAVVAVLSANAAASPVLSVLGPRNVTELDQAAFEEAQQRDATATRAFSNTQIKTSDGTCLFVDELSGDFRANLTPIQIADCGATDGQGWDVITSGTHNNVADSALIVSTLTGACFNFDPRRAAGNQVLLFSCGGRADGSGQVTNSQLFAFNGTESTVTFSPENQPGSCFVVTGDVLDIADCASGDATQVFTFAGAAADGATAVVSTPAATTSETESTALSTLASVTISKKKKKCKTVTGTTSVVAATTSSAASTDTTAAAAVVTSSAAVVTNDASGAGIPNPTTPVPVSGAGGTLQPSAVAEAQQRDDTATRAFSSVSIQAPNGQCLFVDPTAGDFRENLIPVSLVTCGGTPNEKFDLVTAGVHNNAQGSALIVSSLTQGCVSHDGRRAAGDTINMFSCGGRADGSGQTNTGQLIPYTSGTTFVMAPEDAANATCIIAGNGRLDVAPCANDGTQVFTILT